MSDPSWWPTLPQLERYLGGANVLRTLSDPNKTGQADATIVQTYLDKAKGEVRSTALVKHATETLDNLDAESAQSLLDMALAVAARTAYERGGQGQAMPPRLVPAVEREERNLEKLALGQIVISRASGKASPKLSQFVGVVDPDPTGTGRTVYGLRKSGFL